MSFGASTPAYRPRTDSAAASSRGSSQPTTIRSGRSKSASAEPSRLAEGEEPGRAVDRQRRADDDRVARTGRGEERLDDPLDVRRRQRSIGTGRGRDRDDREAGIVGRGEVGREGKTAGIGVQRERVREAGLEDGRDAALKAGDPGLVDVGDGEAVAESGESDGGHETDVTGADQEQVHRGSRREEGKRHSTSVTRTDPHAATRVRFGRHIPPPPRPPRRGLEGSPVVSARTTPPVPRPSFELPLADHPASVAPAAVVR
jgi:hypothetical protein